MTRVYTQQIGTSLEHTHTSRSEPNRVTIFIGFS